MEARGVFTVFVIMAVTALIVALDAAIVARTKLPKKRCGLIESVKLTVACRMHHF